MQFNEEEEFACRRALQMVFFNFEIEQLHLKFSPEHLFVQRFQSIPPRRPTQEECDESYLVIKTILDVIHYGTAEDFRQILQLHSDAFHSINTFLLGDKRFSKYDGLQFIHTWPIFFLPGEKHMPTILDISQSPRLTMKAEEITEKFIEKRLQRMIAATLFQLLY